jgi:hypothetical protein
MIRSLIERAILIFFWIGMGLADLTGQSPTGIDTRQREPKPFSLEDVLLYIVAPVVILGLSLWYRYTQNKKRLEREEQAGTRD